MNYDKLRTSDLSSSGEVILHVGGQFNNVPLKDVPTKYLEWVAKMYPDDDIAENIHYVLRQRSAEIRASRPPRSRLEILEDLAKMSFGRTREDKQRRQALLAEIEQLRNVSSPGEN